MKFTKSKLVIALLSVLLGFGYGWFIFGSTAQVAADEYTIVIERADDGFNLTCEKGCAWSSLSWTDTNASNVYGFDYYGMWKSESEVDNRDSANFEIYPIMTRNGFELECKSGCAWRSLEWTCEGLDQCSARIDASGIHPVGQ